MLMYFYSFKNVQGTFSIFYALTHNNKAILKVFYLLYFFLHFIKYVIKDFIKII